jgi:HPt (histidine-containing phosphotransfer) domain-containing protein
MAMGSQAVARTSVQLGAAKPSKGLAGKAIAAPIDRAYFARFTMGNAALEREVLELFATQVPLYLERLRAAQFGKDWKDAAHTIKGSASAIGAWRLARFAEMAEKIDIGADLAHTEGHRDEAVAAVAEAIDEVCRYITRLIAVA